MNPKDSPTASERAEGPADERAAFEVWAHLNLFGLELNAAGSYEHRATRYAWQGWLARSRLAAATRAPLQGECEYVINLLLAGGHVKPETVEQAIQIAVNVLAASPSPRAPEQPEQPSVNTGNTVVGAPAVPYTNLMSDSVTVNPVESGGTLPDAVDDGRDTRAPGDNLRGEFEAFHSRRKNKGIKWDQRRFDRYTDQTYIDESVQRHWWTWQNAVAAIDAAIAKEKQA